MTYSNTYSRKLALMTLAAIFLFACKKTDRFFDELVASPELVTGSTMMYKTSYRVGDTMLIYGRLKGDLQVKIGNASPVVMQAQQVMINRGSTQLPYDCLKVPIITAMGIGSGREVSIRGGGVTIYGPPIEIYEGGGGTLSDSLRLVSYATLPADAVLFHCRDGKGSVYMYANGSLQMVQHEQTQTLLSAFADQDGPFQIINMFSGGIDKGSKWLYFSAQTEDGQPDNQDHLVFRLCRMDLHTKQITTINRTRIPKKASSISVTTWLPWEGSITQIKMIAAQQIFPAEDGSVYIVLSCPVILSRADTTAEVRPGLLGNLYAIVQLDAAGNVKYLFRKEEQYAPWVFNPVNGSSTALDSYPGTELKNITTIGVLTVSPDEKLMYLVPVFFNANQGVNLYDLNTRVLLYEYRKSRLPSGEIPQFTGPFNALINGFYFYGNYHSSDGFGFMPLPGERLLILFYQGLYYNRELYGTPAWSTLDFARNRGDLYAPSYCELGNYRMSADDLLLNYDETGHLYMTANNNKEIVKTTPR